MNVLFLAHRLPYPPNKGDKTRSYHVLAHLLARHRVMLGTFVDDPADEQHLPQVRSLCADLHVGRLRRGRARLRSLRGFFSGAPLSLAYYEDPALARWVQGLRDRDQVDAVFVFSSSMLPYARGFNGPVVVDFADVDSEKWAAYSRTRAWPLSWVYRREARTLQRVEREAALHTPCALFATEVEAALFRRIAPESAVRVAVMNNGVDTDYFAPTPDRRSPYAAGEMALVFNGTMNYWPNVDAVTWLARDMLPRLRARWPALRLYVVGRNPSRAVRRLAGAAVHVTGTVPDVRPYLQHAVAVAAPVRLSHGIQNKVLEAMAMGKPVVATRPCAAAIDAQVGHHLLAADDAEGFVRELGSLIESPARAKAVGDAARARMQSHYRWADRLAALDRHFVQPPAAETLQ